MNSVALTFKYRPLRHPAAQVSSAGRVRATPGAGGRMAHGGREIHQQHGGHAAVGKKRALGPDSPRLDSWEEWPTNLACFLTWERGRSHRGVGGPRGCRFPCGKPLGPPASPDHFPLLLPFPLYKNQMFLRRSRFPPPTHNRAPTHTHTPHTPSHAHRTLAHMYAFPRTLTRTTHTHTHSPTYTHSCAGTHTTTGSEKCQSFR